MTDNDRDIVMTIPHIRRAKKTKNTYKKYDVFYCSLFQAVYIINMYILVHIHVLE